MEAGGSSVTRRRVERLISFGLAVAVLWVAGRVWNEYIAFFGFPDGYKSELGIAENTMAVWFCWFSVALAAMLFALVWRSLFASIGRLLLVVCALYFLVAAGCIALDLYDQTYMMGSAGG